MARHRMRRGRRVVKVERRAAARARAAVVVECGAPYCAGPRYFGRELPADQVERFIPSTAAEAAAEMDAVSIVKLYVRARLAGRE